MRHKSPQASQSSGHRGCGSRGAVTSTKRSDVGSVWEVVSTLASALTDARDHLVTLINNSNASATRMSGGGTAPLSASCSRHQRSSSCLPYPGARAWVRNVHRGHAHGHVAFGCSSEYRLHPMPVRVKTPQPLFRAELSPPPEGKRPPQRCVHPLHKMHALPLRGGTPGTARPCPIVRPRNVAPDRRRQGIGTQYAALLRDESYAPRASRGAGRS